MTKWHFSPQLADQVEAEITQRDQFDNDDVDISETIVREAVQNSLDAAVDDPSRVKVTFRWVDRKNGIKPDFFRKLFEGQLDHARAADIDVASLDFANPTALVIEDFGTCGLTGSTHEKDNDNFSDFWRRHGKSHKTGKSRGRWGLGKLVYSTTSQVGVFFGVTNRKGDPRSYLMGQTVLNVRKVDGKQYPPHAFFADLEHEQDPFLKIPVPVKDDNFVAEFRNNFSIQRKNEPGVSIIIPFPDIRFNVEQMIGVAIANYFYPLITGQLVLQFDEIEINSRNVRSLAKRYAAERFSQIDMLFDFIEEVYRAQKGRSLALKPGWINDETLGKDNFEPDVLEAIRKKFSEGELVGLYLPVTVRMKDGQARPSGFSVYLKRPEELSKGLDLYVRGGLTLPAEAKFRERRALGAMIAEDEAICDFLGDAENAAHTQWTTHTEKLKRNYRYYQRLVFMIKHAVLQLYDLLADVTEGRDDEVLQDFFWFEDTAGNARKKRKNKKALFGVAPKPDPLFAIKRVKGGFSIMGTDEFSKEKLPREVSVEVAYAVDGGNAFKKYSPYDFRVGKNGGIQLVPEPPQKVISARENRWVLEVGTLPFTITATGFDENRDLKIKIS
jgi:hypothetical protein